MAGMGTDFRNRLKDGLAEQEEAVGFQCQACDQVFDLDQDNSGFCEACWLDQWYADEAPEGPMDDWSFVRDFRL